MKILILNWRDIKNPNFGGAEVATYEIAKRWVKWGNEVTWFSSKFKNCKEKENICGIKIIRQGSTFTVHLKSFLYYRKHFKNKFDLVIDQVHGIPFFTPLYVKESKIVYIHEVAEKIWFKEWLLPIAIFGYFSDLLTFRLFYRKIKFITGSLSTLKDLQSAGIPKSNIKIVNYGISKTKISSKIKKEKDPTVIFLGRLYRSKRVEDIIKAVKLLVKKYPKINLWIVGKGKNSYTKKLINLVNDLKIDKNVTFYGFLEEKEKNELLKRSWATVMTSVKEGWGLSVLEAAFYSTPSVVYNSHGLSETVINGETGIICKKNTSGNLAKNIGKLIKDEKLRKIFGEKAKKNSRNFSWDKTAKEILTTSNSVINPKSYLKNELFEKFWNKKEYIEAARKFDFDTNDSFWMNILKERSKSTKKILDVGCCEGTRLNLLNKKANLFGVDLSEKAIEIGRQKNKNIKFIKADAEKLPFPNLYFDLVYSVNTIEHLTSIEKVIHEMIRVTRKNGYLAFIAPNYGSPLVPTPISKWPRAAKIFKAISQEFSHLSGLNNSQRVNWDMVTPKITNEIKSDYDLVNKPYLPSLIWVLKNQGLKIELTSSGWEGASNDIPGKLNKFIFLVFKKTRFLNLYPIKYWGPTIFLLCKKI